MQSSGRRTRSSSQPVVGDDAVVKPQPKAKKPKVAIEPESASLAAAATISTLTNELVVYNADTPAVIKFINLCMMTRSGATSNSILSPDVNHHYVNRNEVYSKKVSEHSLFEIFTGDGSVVDEQVQAEILRGVELVFFKIVPSSSVSSTTIAPLSDIVSGEPSTLHGLFLQPTSAYVTLLSSDISTISGLVEFGQSLGMIIDENDYSGEPSKFAEVFRLVHSFYQGRADAVFVGIEEGAHRSSAAKSAVISLVTAPGIGSLLVKPLSVTLIGSGLSVEALKERSDRICRSKMSGVARSTGDQLFDIVVSVKGPVMLDRLTDVESLGKSQFNKLSTKIFQEYRDICHSVVNFIAVSKFGAVLRQRLKERIVSKWADKYHNLVEVEESVGTGPEAVAQPDRHPDDIKVDLVIGRIRESIDKRAKKLTWFSRDDKTKNESKLVRIIPGELRALMDFVVLFVASGLYESKCHHTIRVFFTDPYQVKLFVKRVLSISLSCSDPTKKELVLYQRNLSVFKSLWESIKRRIDSAVGVWPSFNGMESDLASLDSVFNEFPYEYETVLMNCDIDNVGFLQGLITSRVSSGSVASAITERVANTANKFSFSVGNMNPPKKKVSFSSAEVAGAAAIEYLRALQVNVARNLAEAERDPTKAVDIVNGLSASFQQDLEDFGEEAHEESGSPEDGDEAGDDGGGAGESD